MLDNPFLEEIFPNIQSKPPLVQLEAVSSCPIVCHLGEETDPCLSTPPLQVVIEHSDFIQLKSEKLSVDEVSELVISPYCGAVSLFIGEFNVSELDLWVC
uniref:Uncharacterized protein n=1 Tax=Calidris pygmaea TaxID=425635 RepID=A0A8C3JPI2_9CHAR